MRMIASAKLHRAQSAIGSTLPYERKLHDMLSAVLFSDDMEPSPYVRTGKAERVAIVAFSSNSALAGAFNANVIKKFQTTVEEKYADLPAENILVFPVGKKIYDAVAKMGYAPQGEFHHMADKPNYDDAAGLARRLTDMFLRRDVDRVELVYNHFRTMATQVPTNVTYLPFAPAVKPESASAQTGGWSITPDFIFEPSREELLDALLPKVLELKIYTTLLDSATAEHAARTVAMQIATDNAEDMLRELTLLYNKTRQQAITAELQDIVSGAAV